jgi:hypothetical protein
MRDVYQNNGTRVFEIIFIFSEIFKNVFPTTTIFYVVCGIYCYPGKYFFSTIE